VDNDGSVETSDFLYDAQRGVLYTYGKTILLARMARPRVAAFSRLSTPKAISCEASWVGWYLVGLNAGQCGTKQSAAFGCKFDANGNPTECGAAEINFATGELDVVVAQ